MRCAPVYGRPEDVEGDRDDVPGFADAFDGYRSRLSPTGRGRPRRAGVRGNRGAVAEIPALRASGGSSGAATCSLTSSRISRPHTCSCSASWLLRNFRCSAWETTIR